MYCPYPISSLIEAHAKIPNSKIHDIFKHVKINSPLLDANKQVPACAKFLKDLLYCEVKYKCIEKGFSDRSGKFYPMDEHSTEVQGSKLSYYFCNHRRLPSGVYITRLRSNC